MGKTENLCINAIAMISADAVEKAKSGHPGMPMGDAAMAFVLWRKFLKHNPKNPKWTNRDRFVLSAGHGSMLLYSLLHLTGYDISLKDIKEFRQWGSKTPGHPEYRPECGVETTTGPLGQGFAAGVGMAMAERYLSGFFNRPGLPVVDHYVYAIASDGDIMEGVSAEAASLAGHLGLGKLIYLYSDNKITIEGSTSLSFTEDVGGRFKAYGWHVEHVDGYDLKAVEAAIRKAKSQKKKPSLIIAKTHIGRGSPNKEDSSEAHGAPLGEEELSLTKKRLGWPKKPFYIPKEALRAMRTAVEKGRHEENKWKKLFERYKRKHPALAKAFMEAVEGKLPAGWADALPSFKAGEGNVATRKASGSVLNSIAGSIPLLIGGSSDLAPSNNTYLKKYPDFGKKGGRNIHFGVREHAMGAVLNGMALSGMLIPYGGTFLVFSDYMRPAIRIAALTKSRVIYVFTHDSIGLGEDGPTHQPVEHLAGLRAIPNLLVIRPADANETVVAWRTALEHKAGPVALILTRQSLPVIDRKTHASHEGLKKGGYIISDSRKKTPDIIILSSGSEVSLCLEAAAALRKMGADTRVVNMPSFELFEAQPKAYREGVLPPSVQKRLAVEAGAPLSWHKYVGLGGAVIGIERFGESAPGKVIFEKFGFTVQNVVKKALEIIRS